MTQHQTQSPQFFLTAPSPCPYVEGQFERKVFTHLVGDKAPELNDLLTQGGFRRSQNIAYRPACETCRACVSVRVVVEDFVPSRSMRRVEHHSSVTCIVDSSPVQLLYRPGGREKPRDRALSEKELTAFMTHLDAVDEMSQAAKLKAGSWGLFHELGHNHQQKEWTFEGTGEVTNNLWSLYLMEVIAGKKPGQGHDALNDPIKRSERAQKYMDTGAKFDQWKGDPFLALEMDIGT